MGAGTDQAAGSGEDLGRSRSRDSCQEPGRRPSVLAGDSTPTSPAPTQLRPQDAPTRSTDKGPSRRLQAGRTQTWAKHSQAPWVWGQDLVSRRPGVRAFSLGKEEGPESVAVTF